MLAAVSSALGDENELQIVGLGIKEVPRSGKPNQLIEYFGIDSKAIAKKIKEII